MLRKSGIELLAHISIFTLYDVNVKFGYSEKAIKFEKIFHLKFDATE